MVMISDLLSRCGKDWYGRFRCARPECARCCRRQFRRECRATIQGLGRLQERYVPITLRLGVVEDIGATTALLRSSLRNRLNLCRRAFKRWTDVAVWGWIGVAVTSSPGHEITAYAVARIGQRLDAGEVRTALERTWRNAGQVIVGPVVGSSDFPALVTNTLGRALAFNVGRGLILPAFRSLRFRYGRAARREIPAHVIGCEPMPILL
jgi:hypothetical protein